MSIDTTGLNYALEVGVNTYGNANTAFMASVNEFCPRISSKGVGSVFSTFRIVNLSDEDTANAEHNNSIIQVDVWGINCNPNTIDDAITKAKACFKHAPVTVLGYTVFDVLVLSQMPATLEETTWHAYIQFKFMMSQN